MIDWVSSFDESLFTSINGSCSACDNLMWWASNSWIWTPVYLGFILALFKKYLDGRNRLTVILSLIICVSLGDLISARIIKPLVGRERPSHKVELAETIVLHEYADGEVYKGGKYSFVSSHATNHMAIAVLVSLLLDGGLWMLMMVAWAILIGYSRIHLGVHYPSDVICGWLLGGGIGFTTYYFARKRL